MEGAGIPTVVDRARPAAQHRCGRPTSFAPWSHADVEQSLPARFARQVAEHASCLALHDRDGSLTFDELDRWSNAIAQQVLARLGPGSEPVPLLFRQGAASTAATLGVLKAGKLYVPLDPDDLPARLAALAERLSARLVLHGRETDEPASRLAALAPLLDVDAPTDDASAPGVEISPDDPAYVFFTSGSTGESKGVLDCHRNVLHNVLRYTNALSLAPSDRLTLLQAPGFSGAVSSLFGALLNGAQAICARPAEEGADRLAERMLDQRVTVYHSVPAIFRRICTGDRRFTDVRVVRLEGDRASALDAALHRRHFAPRSVLANGLGTTETGLARQLRLPWGAAVADGILPVGFPVQDVDVFVLDEKGGECPPGAVGEIAARSAYLALGYWNRPDLTAAAFRPDGSGRRVYRTGDMGRLREDGCLEYLGRRDFRLKVLGNTVDPAGVEDALLRLPGVREVVAATVEDRHGSGRLVAYLVPDGELPPARELRARLSRDLPAWMVPSSFVVVEELPLGPNGKLDRRSLSLPAGAGAAGGAPHDDLERALVELWSEVLEVPVGVDDDFFDLGGDSLAAAEIVARLEVDTGLIVPASVLVNAPTVALLAQELGRPRDGRGPSVLTPLATAGAEPPLILVHGKQGSAVIYAPLVHALAGRRAVWALESDGDDVDRRLETLAARHVETLTNSELEPPYLLAGHCYAGVVAFEMAHQLHTAGVGVELAMYGISPFDLPRLVAPAARERWSRARGIRTRRTSAGRVLDHVAYARRLPPGEAFGYLRRHTASRLRSVAERLNASPRGRTVHASAAAFMAYQEVAFPGRATLILSAESLRSYSTRPSADWSPLADGGVTVHVVSGDDPDLLAEPHATEVAAVLAGFCAR